MGLFGFIQICFLFIGILLLPFVASNTLWQQKLVFLVLCMIFTPLFGTIRQALQILNL